jgi:imidazolonepropionase-like amidohydrolase
MVNHLPEASSAFIRPFAVLDVISGEIHHDRAVVVEGGRIVSVVSCEQLPPDAAPIIDLPRHTLLPGLIDCHAHLVGDIDHGHGYAEILTHSAAHEVMFGVRNARDTLNAGFTTVRDLGTLRAFADTALRDGINAGWTPGPRMQVVGAYITSPGGGGDVAGLAPDIDAVIPKELRFGVVETVEDVRRVVRQLVQGGAEAIKVIATGSVMSAGGVPGAPELTEDQIRTAVEEAAQYGVYVAAHAHGAEGIKRAVRAGVRSVEHGSLMDDEGVRLMAASGTYLVADIYAGDYIRETGTEQGWDPDVLRKNDETTITQRNAFAKCVAAGVPIAFGTDSGIYPHGLNARQLAYHVAWGQSPLEAIRSATLTSAKMIGWDDRVGSIEPGHFADLIAVEGNPLEDVRLLEQVQFVMKGGEVVLNRT